VSVFAKSGVNGVGFAEIVEGVAEALFFFRVCVEGGFEKNGGNAGLVENAESAGIHLLVAHQVGSERGVGAEIAKKRVGDVASGIEIGLGPIGLAVEPDGGVVGFGFAVGVVVEA